MNRVTANICAEDKYLVATIGFVATREGVVLVDTPQCPSNAREWRVLAEGRGVIRYIINTEHHRDHITGNTFFPGIVVSHSGTAERFFRSLSPVEQIRQHLKDLDPEGADMVTNYIPRAPTIFFDSELTIRLGDHTFELHYAPGHVPNGIWVYVPEERTVFTGDNVINGAPPFLHSAVPSSWLKTLDALAKLNVEHVVPGHGPPCGADAITRTKSAITEVIDEVRRMRDAGDSREQVQNKLHYIDRFSYPAEYSERYHHLEYLGAGRVYDWLAGQI